MLTQENGGAEVPLVDRAADIVAELLADVHLGREVFNQVLQNGELAAIIEGVQQAIVQPAAA